MSKITDYILDLESKAMIEHSDRENQYVVLVNGNELVRHLKLYEAQTLADECTGFGIADVCIDRREVV
jgi:hypothetical protein